MFIGSEMCILKYRGRRERWRFWGREGRGDMFCVVIDR